ncbi:hypothetical protein ABZ864_36065 [Streptomyces sp. NPDC047082]
MRRAPDDHDGSRLLLAAHGGGAVAEDEVTVAVAVEVVRILRPGGGR